MSRIKIPKQNREKLSNRWKSNREKQERHRNKKILEDLKCQR